jgi:hypothetical protein
MHKAIDELAKEFLQKKLVKIEGENPAEATELARLRKKRDFPRDFL